IILISICICFIPSKEVDINDKDNKTQRAEFHKWKLAPIAVIFVICILCVMRVIDYRVMLLVCILLTTVIDYKLFAKADYILLLTFVAFFILTGNIKSMSFIENGLSNFVAGREFMSGILLSQVISNVPSAVLLSGFTDNAEKLLVGVNIGGLGTPVASLASLISYKYYSESKNARNGKYMLLFMLINFVMLLIMIGVGKFYV
ncbi:MAG: citrate transporter, partial [Oscillospiraceae bacterium]|nr:citrate transporter [Oscillospiraceae bacterium]